MSSRRVALDKRKRTEKSCDVCKARKQKCDKPLDADRCRYCQIHDLECTTNQPRKKRLYGSFEGVGTRIQLLESLVKGLVPEANLSSNDEMRRLGSFLGIPLPETDADASALEKSVEKSEAAESLPLLPDQQGGVQYTGPASSFSFNLRLRTLLDASSKYEFVLFGPNAADQAEVVESGRSESKGGNSSEKPKASSVKTTPTDYLPALEIDVPLYDALIKSFFETTHPDFPVLHEASFRSQYESWSRTQTTTDRVWLCCLLCVCMLSWRTAPVDVPPELERVWWRHIQSLLPMVFFTTNITAIHALMLAALHLQNTLHRDACWNLTGTAIRIAHAIGLHSGEVTSYQSSLTREFRKSLWWTLMAFEQLQISSYDRPSAIDSSQCSVASPDERIVGLGFYYPPDFVKTFNRLTTLLASACRARRVTGKIVSDESGFETLSPAAIALRELHRWKDTLTSHLRLESLELSAPCYFRPLLLLHAQYQYAIIALSRSALLQHATVLSHSNAGVVGQSLLTMSDACRQSGRELTQILLRLDAVGRFNALTWFDMFYAATAALALVLDIVCFVKQGNGQNSVDEGAKSMKLLQELCDMAERYTRHPRIPSTTQGWIDLILDIGPMAARYARSHRASEQHNNGVQAPVQRQTLAINDARLLVDLRRSQARQGHLTTTNASSQSTSEAPGERSPMTMSADPSVANIQEWRWDDIEAMLNM